MNPGPLYWEHGVLATGHQRSPWTVFLSTASAVLCSSSIVFPPVLENEASLLRSNDFYLCPPPHRCFPRVLLYQPFPLRHESSPPSFSLWTHSPLSVPYPSRDPASLPQLLSSFTPSFSLNFWQESLFLFFSFSFKMWLLFTGYWGTCKAGLEIWSSEMLITAVDLMEGEATWTQDKEMGVRRIMGTSTACLRGMESGKGLSSATVCILIEGSLGQCLKHRGYSVKEPSPTFLSPFSGAQFSLCDGAGPNTSSNTFQL